MIEVIASQIVLLIAINQVFRGKLRRAVMIMIIFTTILILYYILKNSL